jgi:hypothetical protein
MPVPQDIKLLVRWAKEPALEKLVGNGARCDLNSHPKLTSYVKCIE